jgi:hypothetical protein
LNIPTKIFIALLVLCLPIALMAIITPANEYLAQGIDAIDCDGPISVFIFSIPSYLLYGIGFIFFAIRYSRNSLHSYLVITLLCGLVVLAITPNIIAAFNQQNKLSHSMSCNNNYAE